MDEIKIREAERKDCTSLRELIQELANFEKMPDGPKLDAKALERDGFCENPLFYSFVAEVNHELVGYAIYYYIFSTWRGKSMFLDELFVLPAYRKKGIGSQLFGAVVQKAVDVNCSRLDFTVLDWNPAADFYKKKGVLDITQTEKWHLYRMDENTLRNYSSTSKSKLL